MAQGMSKYDIVQNEIAKGGSYQQEVLKLLCEIAESLECNRSIIGLPHTSPITEDMLAFNKEEAKPIKRKRGRPPKRR